MKNKVKFIALGLCCCLLLGIFVVFSLPQKQTVYATFNLNKEFKYSSPNIKWTEIKEQEYIKEISRKNHIPFSKAEQINLENNMKQVPEAFAKNADDSYAPKIVYRTLTLTQDTKLDTQVIIKIYVKMVSKGTYSHAHADKKFLEVANTSIEVKGKLAPIWDEGFVSTIIEEDNEKENTLWIAVVGALKYEIDAKVAVGLNLGDIIKIDGDGSTKLQYSEPISIEGEFKSKDY